MSDPSGILLKDRSYSSVYQTAGTGCVPPKQVPNNAHIRNVNFKRYLFILGRLFEPWLAQLTAALLMKPNTRLRDGERSIHPGRT